MTLNSTAKAVAICRWIVIVPNNGWVAVWLGRLWVKGRTRVCIRNNKLSMAGSKPESAGGQ